MKIQSGGAMAVSYLTKTELGEFLHHNGNIEAGVRSALIDSLEQSGVFKDDDNSARGWLESGPFHGGAVPPTVQILDVSRSTSVETNPNLKAIVLDDHSGKLDVTGGANNVFVAAGRGSDTINLHDSGDDTVYGGGGNDVIRGGHGDSSLFGGAGNDSIFGGTGNDTLDGGSGNDYLVSGGALASGAGGGQSPSANAGGHQRVASADDQAFGNGRGGDHGDDHDGDHGGGRGHGGDHGGGSGGGPGGDHGGGSGGAEGHSTLIGGAGNDTLVGVQGDVMQGGAGNDQFVLKGGSSDANSTLQGGGGNDTFRIESHSGNDTIFGGDGRDSVDFVGRSFFDVAKIDVDSSTSTYTLHFTDDQTVAVNGVEDLHFTDQTVNLPKLS
ncbi:calcium-binding protein [Nitrobacter sp. NHB1]|uniref:calcium-binding protein n=1 Tax=Nitrobacter sp. NHB1 TaxID=3119830 RepID=UPI002FFEC2A8